MKSFRDLRDAFPMWCRVEMTDDYPREWIARSPNKSQAGTVIGYGNGGTSLRVLRDGAASAQYGDPPRYWRHESPTKPDAVARSSDRTVGERAPEDSSSCSLNWPTPRPQETP